MKTEQVKGQQRLFKRNDAYIKIILNNLKNMQLEIYNLIDLK